MLIMFYSVWPRLPLRTTHFVFNVIMFPSSFNMYKQHASEEKPSARLFFCFLNLFVRKKHDQSFTQAASVPPHRNDNVSDKKKNN